MAVIQMTDEEKALLDLAYTDGERILEGKLFDYQEKALKELRACQEYLKVRYPEEDFKAISFQPSSKKGCVELQFIRPAESEIEYLLKYDEVAKYTDNFYDVPYEREYDGIVESILEKAGIKARVYTSFPFLIGDEIRSGLDLMNRRPHLGRHTEIFLDVKALPTKDEAKALEEQVRALFKEKEIYSSCILFYVLGLSEMADKTVQEIDAYCRNRKNKEKIFSHAFRCFDLN
ncbi:MAG: hypothetical protein J6Z22_03750 [Lachnospiraceae bacterium]|nr:hypothetical protein [Lachnospiraceae bacterium]